MNRDFVDLLRAFKDADVRFLVVGAYALAHHGRPRATGDLDVWVEATPVNATRVMRALAAFGRADLDGGETDARSVVHRLQHIVGEFQKLGVDLLHGGGDEAELGVGEGDDRQRGHSH